MFASGVVLYVFNPRRQKQVVLFELKANLVQASSKDYIMRLWLKKAKNPKTITTKITIKN